MSDIIHLLPDHLANQIAAGEVIQRPASAVKELLENAVDAGATEVKLLINDAGKALVQVVDNGGGMSETDARMAFERHATSKIRSIDDLFSIQTMGFRGEALASIAAVAQVELRTRRAADELGVFIEIENSQVLRQEPVQCPVGTSIAMKNVFFNVPARRSFLKSNTTELRNIIDEFTRVAMAFPGVHFSMQSNGQQVFFLEKGSLKQRLVQLLGHQYQTKLVNIDEDTDYLTISGFVAKPDMARKTRGDQYFFVNNRFIRSAYLNHAVSSAFADLLPKDSFPTYALFIDMDPAAIDINVHPTKQEIKFTDEKIVYAFVQSAVKHALAQFSIAPTLDFTLNPEIQQLEAVQRPANEQAVARAAASSLYTAFAKPHQAHAIDANAGGLQPWQASRQQDEAIREAARQKRNGVGNADGQDDNDPGVPALGTAWQSELSKLKQQLFSPEPTIALQGLDHEQRPISREKRFAWLPDSPVMQLHSMYIVASSNTGYFLVHQQYAHERIVYEQLSKAIHGKQIPTQQSMFPATVTLPAADALLLTELLPDLHLLGYKVQPIQNHSFSVDGTPADALTGNEQRLFEQLLEQLKHFNSDVKFSLR
ncbi:MAG: DNA mismatch repair endonuclease MutL [Bacteroidetes bacterium]|nr:MAG: DNA mismatch repair endonuclease MutL [Bacteroidota bacterium]